MSEKKEMMIKVDSEEATDNKKPEESVPENMGTPPVTGDKKDDTAVEDPIKELEAKLEAKQQEAKEIYERLLRLAAEFENFKKRSAREMEDFRKFANQSLLKEMLSVVDNLELAMNSVHGKHVSKSSLLEGLHLTHKEILRVFEKSNVTPIEAKGRLFDPTYHEAVMQEETDEYPENTVVNELQKGYLIHDRLLRPAMVVVAKPKTKNLGSKIKPEEMH